MTRGSNPFCYSMCGRRLQLSDMINFKSIDMWYNNVVYDDSNNEIGREKYFVNKDDMWFGKDEDYWGKDVLGNWILEFWSEK